MTSAIWLFSRFPTIHAISASAAPPQIGMNRVRCHAIVPVALSRASKEMPNRIAWMVSLSDAMIATRSPLSRPMTIATSITPRS